MLSVIRRVSPDVFIAVFLLGLEIFLWQVNSQAPERANYYPKYILIFSFILTTLLLISGILNTVKKSKDSDQEVSKDYNYHLVLIIVFLTAVYIALINSIGYSVSTVLYIFCLMRILGIKEIKTLILVPFITTLLLYVVFNHLLFVLLPEGYFFGG